MLPANLIDDDETIILLLRPSPLYIILGSLTSIAVILIVMMLLAYLANRFPRWIGWSDAEAFSLGAAAITLRLIWQTLDWWCRVYVLTDRRVIRRMGVLRVVIFQSALNMIQHTSVFTQIRERLFSLGTIGFATAGTSSFEAFWHMIPRPFAVHKTVVETINRYGRKRL